MYILSAQLSLYFKKLKLMHLKILFLYKNMDDIDSNVLFSFLKHNSDSDFRKEEDKEEIIESDICIDGNECDIITDKGLMVCKKCGKMSQKIIEHGAEWRYYGSEDSKSSDHTRCGLPANFLLKNSSVGSIISNHGITSADMKRVRKYHIWNAMPYKERSLYNVFDSIFVRSNNHGIPACIIDDAKENYKLLDEAQISRGTNRKGLIAACIYIACKKRNVPRSAKEIAKIFNLSITSMTRGCKQFMHIMNMHKKEDPGTLTIATKPDDFIYRFCSNLNLNSKIQELCMKVTKTADNYSLVSQNTPPSVAAGCIYLVSNFCKLGLTKKDIATSCGISEVTISKCYKKLNEYKKHLFSKEDKQIFGF